MTWASTCDSASTAVLLMVASSRTCVSQNEAASSPVLVVSSHPGHSSMQSANTSSSSSGSLYLELSLDSHNPTHTRSAFLLASSNFSLSADTSRLVSSHLSCTFSNELLVPLASAE